MGVASDALMTAPIDAELVEELWREEGAKIWRSVAAYAGDPDTASDAVAERPARLDGLDQLKVPDLWPEVTERRSRPPSGPSPFRRFAIAALALLLGGLAFVFLVRVWPGGERGTATSPTARTPVPTTTP